MMFAKSFAGRALQSLKFARRAANRQPLFATQRWLSDNAVATTEEDGEVATYTADEKIKRQRELTVTSSANRGLFVPDDQLPAIEHGEEGVLAGSTINDVYDGRIATIEMPPKNAMSSGSYKYRHWRISFDQQTGWTNHLMGACLCWCVRRIYCHRMFDSSRLVCHFHSRLE